MLPNHLNVRSGSSGRKGRTVKLTFRSSCINYDNSSSGHRSTIESLEQRLDYLYRAMLSSNGDHERVHLALAAILILPRHLEPTTIRVESLLGMHGGMHGGMPRGMPRALYCETLVSRFPTLSSMLNIGGQDDVISLDPSFRDFLLNEKRAGSFYIDIHTQTHTIAVAQKWLESFSCWSLGYLISPHFFYSCSQIYLPSATCLALNNRGTRKTCPSQNGSGSACRLSNQLGICWTLCGTPT